MSTRKGAIDRRVQRSREALQRAHIALILLKDYDAITVQDICDAANIGRSTFYAHYKSIDDLKRSGVETLRGMLGERQKQAHALGRPATRAFSFSLPMFEHARDNIDHYRALAGGRGGVIALVGIRRIIADLARAEINPLGDKGSADFIGRDFIVQYVVGAFMSVLTGWLDAGAKLPPDRIDAMFQRLATRGVVRKAS